MGKQDEIQYVVMDNDYDAHIYTHGTLDEIKYFFDNEYLDVLEDGTYDAEGEWGKEGVNEYFNKLKSVNTEDDLANFLEDFDMTLTQLGRKPTKEQLQEWLDNN
jgi:hypothetical protein